MHDRLRAAVRWVRARALALVVVSSAYLVSYLSTVQTLPLFAPDTRYYAAMALWFGGTSKEEAAARVGDYTARAGFAPVPADQLFGWALVQPRIVLPALSAPFVKVFGISAMAVVPALAMAALVLVLTVMLSARYGTVPAVAPVLLVLASLQLMFFGSAMLTESLAALFGALILWAAWRYQRAPDVRGVAQLVVLTVLLGFTRQSTLIPAGAMAVAWVAAVLLRRRPNPWRVPALAVVGTSLAVQVLQMLVWPGFSQLAAFEAKTHTHSLAGALRAAPALGWRLLRADTLAMVRYDRALLVLLALAVVSMLVLWRRSESHLLLGALLGTQVYDVTNGTPVVFRYGMPGLVFVVASAALLVSRAAASATRAGRPVSDGEPEPRARPTARAGG